MVPANGLSDSRRSIAVFVIAGLSRMAWRAPPEARVPKPSRPPHRARQPACLRTEFPARDRRRRCAAGAKIAVLLLDLDHFKPINDNLGHQVGDRFLQEVSRRLRSAIRKQDTLARLGGDEFAVF